MLNSINYKGFIIDYSKNKISIFDSKDHFYGYYNFIVEAKLKINKLKAMKLNSKYLG